MQRFYPIGTPGKPWGEAEKRQWLEAQTVQRSYYDDVVAPLAELAKLDDGFEVHQYGALSIDPDRYPLLSVTVRTASPSESTTDGSTADTASWVLITGGVHGYETSGVHGAIEFLKSEAITFRDRINLLIAPCVSPWGYEVINRWNPSCLDPNRSFRAQSPAEESAALMKMLSTTGVDFLVHMDLHETTDSDETEFRPATAARDGEVFKPGTIPDGFYTVGDSENPQPAFQAAVISGVNAITHIAPADNYGKIIGSDVTQEGVINYPFVELGLCAGVTNARFTTTTEVYPDSPRATPSICNQAQVAAVRAGLEYALNQLR